jgi:hypothetical protein
VLGALLISPDALIVTDLLKPGASPARPRPSPGDRGRAGKTTGGSRHGEHQRTTKGAWTRSGLCTCSIRGLHPSAANAEYYAHRRRRRSRKLITGGTKIAERLQRKAARRDDRQAEQIIFDVAHGGAGRTSSIKDILTLSFEDRAPLRVQDGGYETATTRTRSPRPAIRICGCSLPGPRWARPASR